MPDRSGNGRRIAYSFISGTGPASERIARPDPNLFKAYTKKKKLQTAFQLNIDQTTQISVDML